MESKITPQERLSKRLFIAGVLVGITWIALALWLVYGDLLEKIQIGNCLIYENLGIYCPGCGGTRALIAFAQGRIWDSFLYHPIVVYCAGFYVTYMVSYGVYLSSGQKIGHLYYKHWWLVGGIALILLQWVIKLILHEYFGYVIM